jgi:hypothetical protein
MELIEIIKSTLSIFSTTAVVFMIISYTIYKIKDSSRVKPYLKFNVQNPINATVKEGAGIKIAMEERPMETILLNRLPIQDKFTIINGNVTIGKQRNRKENSEPRLFAEDNKKMFDYYTV